MELIEARGLRKDYHGKRAVDDVSFHVRGGEAFGFFGPNGAGKTTTMRLLTGLTPPTAGEVLVFGQAVTRRGPLARRGVSVLPEDPTFYEEMRLIDALRFWGRMVGRRGGALEGRITYLLDLVGLTREAKRRFREFSLGQRKRAEIARILLPDARILFLDEPFAGVDIEFRRKLRSYLREWLSPEKCIFFTSHDLHEAELFVDRFAFIIEGRLAAVGTGRDLRSRFLRPMYNVEVDDLERAFLVVRDAGVAEDVAKRDGMLRVLLPRREAANDVALVLLKSGIRIFEMRAIGTMEDVFDEMRLPGRLSRGG